ncbi:MAG: IS3 family transposase [Candidatus Cloacimonetes bacterium]|nr:IS3 family transposase [Candidatus Cloacimonadota bacterium]
MSKTREKTKKDIIKRFKKGETVSELILSTGIAKSTINDWLRETRLKIEDDDLKTLKKKYGTLADEHDKLVIELEIYKNLSCLPTSCRKTKLEAIKEHYEVYPVKTMCSILNVNVGTFYNHLKRKVNETVYEINDKMLKPEIERILYLSNETFSGEMISKVLTKEGFTISQGKARKLMKELKLIPVKDRVKENKKKENKDKSLRDLLQRNFKTDKPNAVWVGDVTEFKLSGNPFYLCVIIDLYSRKIIAHRVSLQNNTNLIVNTLKDAVASRPNYNNVIFHSDRGANYTSLQYRELMRLLHIRESYSDSGSPHDNAVVESFFKYLKRDTYNYYYYDSLEDLKLGLDKHIEIHNNLRPHTYINNMTPNEFEIEYYNNKKKSTEK